MYAMIYVKGKKEYPNGESSVVDWIYRTPDMNRLYNARGGPSYMYVPDNAEIEFLFNIKDEKEADAFILQWYKDRLKSPEIGDCGWILSDGRMWTCEPWEHQSLASYLVIGVYGVFFGELYLENAGAIKVYKDFIARTKEEKITQPQIDTLGRISLIDTTHERKRRSINNSIKLQELVGESYFAAKRRKWHKDRGVISWSCDT